MSEVSMHQEDNEVINNGEQTSSCRNETGERQLTAINLDQEDEKLIIDEGISLQHNTRVTDCNDDRMKIISENENSMKLGKIVAPMDKEILDMEKDVTLDNEDWVPRIEFVSGHQDLTCHAKSNETEEKSKTNWSDSSSPEVDASKDILLNSGAPYRKKNVETKSKSSKLLSKARTEGDCRADSCSHHSSDDLGSNSEKQKQFSTSGNDRMAVSSNDKLNTVRNNKMKYKINSNRCKRHKMLFEDNISHLDKSNDKFDDHLSLLCIDCKKELLKYVTVVVKPLKCFLCDFRTDLRHELNTHLLKEHKYNENYICNVCEFQALDMKDLLCHITRNHEGVEAFECKFCNFKSAIRSELKNHHNLEHPYLRVHACNFCHLKSTSRLFIQGHMVKDHSNIKPYQCNFCFKRFGRKRDVLRHINHYHFRGRVVIQEPPPFEVNPVAVKNTNFQCSVCKLYLCTKRILKRHIDVQHNGVAMHYKRCNICDKSFSKLSHLNNHMNEEHSVRIQSECYFRCTSCNTTFSRSHDLCKHISLVHKEHLFYCPYCQFTATTQDYLERHMDEVHNEYTLMCSFCDFRAKVREELDIHIAEHTNLMQE